ncbi:Protein Phosphatase Slingshot 2 [Manis pentadactyla]|nr:Protein Phosphatase Slingshot 2 [Manis pentadactyla]
MDGQKVRMNAQAESISFQVTCSHNSEEVDSEETCSVVKKPSERGSCKLSFAKNSASFLNCICAVLELTLDTKDIPCDRIYG